MSIYDLEPGILRNIFNRLDIYTIKLITNSCRDYYNFKYNSQCIPLGIYHWMYGTTRLNKKEIENNKVMLKSHYSFRRYINDIIMFLEDITP